MKKFLDSLLLVLHLFSIIFVIQLIKIAFLPFNTFLAIVFILLSFLLIVSILSFYYFYKVKSQGVQRLSKSIKKIENSGDDILSFFATYIITLLLPLNNYGDLISFLLLIIFVGFLFLKLKKIYVNPLFILLDVQVYKVTFKDLVSEKEEEDIIILSKLNKKELEEGGEIKPVKYTKGIYWVFKER